MAWVRVMGAVAINRADIRHVPEPMGDASADRAAASQRYQALPSPARQRIAWAADEMLRQADWDIWSLLTSSPEREHLLRECTFAAFLAWEQRAKP